MKSYSPADVGEYREGMEIGEKYSCWAAIQFRQKVRLILKVISLGIKISNLRFRSWMLSLQGNLGRLLFPLQTMSHQRTAQALPAVPPQPKGSVNPGRLREPLWALLCAKTQPRQPHSLALHPRVAEA